MVTSTINGCLIFLFYSLTLPKPLLACWYFKINNKIVLVSYICIRTYPHATHTQNTEVLMTVSLLRLQTAEIKQWPGTQNFSTHLTRFYIRDDGSFPPPKHTPHSFLWQNLHSHPTSSPPPKKPLHFNLLHNPLSPSIAGDLSVWKIPITHPSISGTVSYVKSQHTDFGVG